ncbi:MAG TPA: PqqD family protein [Pyrinomonadaceae bacterium]
MKRIPIPTGQFPKMRKHGLVIDELTDEVLVYDLDSDQAHCLNRTAALVWRCCDGNTSAPEIAHRLEVELGALFNEQLVWMALEQLKNLHLLEDSISVPSEFTHLSRRRMIRQLGLAAAVAVPVVTSIVAPTAVQAATCQPSGAPCIPNKLCCSPLGCNGSPGSGTCF